MKPIKRITTFDKLNDKQKDDAKNFFGLRISSREAQKYKWELKDEEVIGAIDATALKDVFSI